MRIEVDQSARHRLFDDLLDPRIGGGRQHAIGYAVFGAGLQRPAGPLLRRLAHRLGQRPEGVAPGQDFADLHLGAALLLNAERVQGLEHDAGQKVELDGEPRAAVHGEARNEARAGKEVVGLVQIAIDEQVLPRHEHLVQDEDRVVLVQARGQRIVERAAQRRGVQFVGRPADELHAPAVHGNHGEQRHVGAAQRRGAVEADEVVVGERRARGDDLGAAHHDARIGLLLHVHENVSDLFGRLVLVQRRVDQRVVEEQAALLRFPIPALRVFVVGRVELGVGAQRARQAGLVVGRAAHPAVRNARPLGDRIPAADEVLRAARHLVERMRHAAAARIRLGRELGLRVGVVQRVVHARQHARGIAEGRMTRHVGDALPIDPHFPLVVQAVEKLRTGQRSRHARSRGGRFCLPGRLGHGYPPLPVRESARAPRASVPGRVPGIYGVTARRCKRNVANRYASVVNTFRFPPLGTPASRLLRA